MSTLKPNLIDNMLSELARTRQTMERQTNTIAEITDKSNNILLQVEAARAMPPNSPSHPVSTTLYSCDKEAVLTLAKILQHFQQFVSGGPGDPPTSIAGSDDFQKYLEQNQQRAEYLGSSVRKLLAAGDQIAQIGSLLHENCCERQHERKLNNDDTLSCE